MMLTPWAVRKAWGRMPRPMEAHPGILVLRLPPESKGKCISRRGRRRLTANSWTAQRGLARLVGLVDGLVGLRTVGQSHA